MERCASCKVDGGLHIKINPRERSLYNILSVAGRSDGLLGRSKVNQYAYEKQNPRDRNSVKESGFSAVSYLENVALHLLRMCTGQEDML